MVLKKFVFVLATLFTIFFGTANITIAQSSNENFDTSLESTYKVEESGQTVVTHHFRIKNKKPTLFIKQYGIKLNSTKIDNIKVVSQGKNLNPEVVTANNITSIGITFPDQIVGQNKVRDFTVIFNNPDVAIVSGKVLEVSIPRQSNPDEFSKHTVNLYTPAHFGLPTRSKPSYSKSDLAPDNEKILTSFKDLSGQSISLLFGSMQVFSIKLKYVLNNNSNSTGIAQIALPPDTPYQKVNYQSLEPRPDLIDTDEDGNWIATYTIPANQTTNVIANILVKVTLERDHVVPFPTPNKKLLEPQKYWEVNNKSIKDLSQSFEDTQQIYDYVVETLTYNYDDFDLPEIPRLGAIKTLENTDQGLCQEFTDLFITLARASQTPARRVTGYAYTQNNILRPLGFVQNILHAWPEYFSLREKAWIPIDPTWENTSGGLDYFNQFDLNHIVFAINGTSSELPYSAGSYNPENPKEETLKVSFAEEYVDAGYDIGFKLSEQKILGIPIPGLTELSIINNTGQAQYNLEFNVTPTDKDISLNISDKILIKSLLPFQSKKIKINAYSQEQFLIRKTLISIYSDDSVQETQLPISANSKLARQLENPYIIASVVSGFVIVTLTTGSILVLISKWKSSVRRKSQKSQKQNSQLQTIENIDTQNQTIVETSKKNKVPSPKE